jgi:hypothetical protein
VNQISHIVLDLYSLLLYGTIGIASHYYMDNMGSKVDPAAFKIAASPPFGSDGETLASQVAPQSSCLLHVACDKHELRQCIASVLHSSSYLPACCNDIPMFVQSS